VLPVLQATPEEAAAHEAVLADLDKASGGKTVWRAAAPAEMA
jgi:DNA polymerase-3 subunit epsilon